MKKFFVFLLINIFAFGLSDLVVNAEEYSENNNGINETNNIDEENLLYEIEEYLSENDTSVEIELN